MTTRRRLADSVERQATNVGTDAIQIFQNGEATTQITVVNLDATGELYVGFDNTVSGTAATQFIGGALTSQNDQIILSDWSGEVWIEGDEAATAYAAERRYIGIKPS